MVRTAEAPSDVVPGESEASAIRSALVETLRAHPGDRRARMYLFQLLCAGGEWDHARAQLRALASQSPEAQMLATAYGQAIDAMLAREAAFSAKAGVPLHVAGSQWVVDFATARDASGRAEALAGAPDTPGEIDGKPFDVIFDGDERFGPTVEAVVAGRWGLIPFAAISSIASSGPVDLRDLVWLPAEIQLREGPRLAALMPVTYPHDDASTDAHRLARRTDWCEVNGAVHGVGQRVWTLSDGSDVPLLGFRRLRFAVSA